MESRYACLILETNPSIFQLQAGRKISQNETASVPGNKKRVYLIKRMLIIRSFLLFLCFYSSADKLNMNSPILSSHTYFLKDNCALFYFYILIFYFLICFHFCFSQIKYDFKHWEMIYRYSAHIFTIGVFSSLLTQRKQEIKVNKYNHRTSLERKAMDCMSDLLTPFCR